MSIQYVNGRLVRWTDEEVQAAIDAAAGPTADTKIPKGVQPVLNSEQAKSRAAFDANFKKESEARKLAEANRVKAQTAWAKKDADNDGIPNGVDKTNNSPPPPAGGSQNGNTNMAKNSTPVKDYINQQLRAAGLPDTPANRAMLRKEYMEIKADETAATAKEIAATNKIITDKATKKEEDDAETAADIEERNAKAKKLFENDTAAYDSIIKSIGGYKTRAGTAKTDAMQRLAELYDPQTAALGTQKQDQLNFLQKVLGQAGTDINASEQNFLSRLINPSAYTDVPLIDMPQQQNALMAALQSQGADTGKVAEQSASDASMNTFMKQLLARSNQQYGNAQTNYVDALRNAGMGAAKSGRDYLALEQPRLASGINTKFADLLAELNTNRVNSEGDIMTNFQNALDDAANKETEAAINYPRIPYVPETTSTPTATTATTPETPATPADATDFMGMTEEEKKRLQEALANLGGFGNFGMGFLTK